jgi:hypothetical protein
MDLLSFASTCCLKVKFSSYYLTFSLLAGEKLGRKEQLCIFLVVTVFLLTKDKVLGILEREGTNRSLIPSSFVPLIGPSVSSPQ